ncbi:hypothetical protein [Rheinheimera sp.]|uniref:hypothetical protein n=1 Tax=Rheinheimera sp. TaxID=1869214 RepID=UPI0027323464|nr:hypothetical protein [Rheinheimera sp.]MDP2713569.1 hypothetical protein [Rheinheimera sp.]
MLRILSVLIFLSCSTLAIAESSKSNVEWGKLASLNLAQIEQQSRGYIQLNRPDLNGVEIKWTQTTANYSKSQGPSLEVVFLHEKSLKPIEESQLLGPLQGVKYYMEFVYVEFSLSGEPLHIGLREGLLTNDKESSEKIFMETYDSF